MITNHKIKWLSLNSQFLHILLILVTVRHIMSFMDLLNLNIDLDFFWFQCVLFHKFDFCSWSRRGFPDTPYLIHLPLAID